jgi:hypothetical protein
MPADPGPEPDVLEGGAIPRRTGRALGLLLALVLVAGLAAWAEGARRSPDERAAIDECATLAKNAVGRAESWLGAMASYVGPVRGTTTAEIDAGLMRMIAEQAPDARAPVDAALRTCRAVEVWPLNAEHRDARDAHVDLLAAEQRRLRAIEDDGRRYYTGFEEVDDLLTEAAALWR